MQAASSVLHFSILPATSCHLVAAPLRNRCRGMVLTPSPMQLPFKSLCKPCVSTQTNVETTENGAEFVEVGYISSVHGIRGEICVKPNTDFPELRFSKPGRRWLRQPVSGKEMTQEVQLVKGRGNPGQKNWILRIGGIDTADQAKQLVGSTLLVRENDRPVLEEGEFYTRDLVGMKVILKETDECIGTVVQVFNTGASDLLQVMLYTHDGTEKSKQAETSVSGPLAWVPFVEAIVPDVDMSKKEMRITPPKGLLELNLRSDERSKKERRQLEWKERKRLQRRLIAAKKKLCEMDQKHIFHGLRYGDKSQRSLLADQIVGVNFKLLQLAMQNLQTTLNRWSLSELINAKRNKLIKDSLKISKEHLASCPTKGDLGINVNFLNKGLHLLSKGKVAIILVINQTVKRGKADGFDLLDSESNENSLFPFLQNSLFTSEMFVKMEERASVPLVLVCPGQEIESLKRLFLNNDHFKFDSNKVWFLKEDKLPIISSSSEEQQRHKILMKSPWEILQSPVGSGGTISMLCSHNMLENLIEMGVEYIEILGGSQNYIDWSPLLLGYTDSCRAEMGFQVMEDMKDSEENFDIVFSINFMKLLTKQMDKLYFDATPKPNSHVELVDKEWIEAVPSSPNSYELSCSIYSAMNACSPGKICVMEIAPHE